MLNLEFKGIGINEKLSMIRKCDIQWLRPHTPDNNYFIHNCVNIKDTTLLALLFFPKVLCGLQL